MTSPLPAQALAGGTLAQASELAGFSESLQRRERLLAAAARASRLLLAAPDAMQAMPEVLRLLGEAAEVDRTALALASSGPSGERWLTIQSEWVAEGVKGQGCDGSGIAWGERKSDCFRSELQSGRSVFVPASAKVGGERASIASERAKSSIIVPIMIDGEYTGAIGFDDCRRPREFDPAVVSALEIAAGLIGATLQRERLLETMRRERERAAEDRVAQLARANAAIRASLDELASEPDLCTFMGHLLLEAARQLGAAAGSSVVLDDASAEWQLIAHVANGEIRESVPFARVVPNEATSIGNILARYRKARQFAPDELGDMVWPGSIDWHRREGHRSVYVLPLVFGDRTLGFVALAFREEGPLSAEQTELLLALTQQATLAIGLRRLASAAEHAAVLAERNRIGQEIHDGLAQGFTGILMQLAAAEEHMGCTRGSPLPVILGRIRDLAREGLTEARRSVLALRPEAARAGGLELALRQLAERTSVPGGVRCSFEGGGTTKGLPPEHQHELLRIAQEAVSNAVRHASPKNVRITLVEEPGEWVMRVRDDGRGMRELPERLAQRGFGLANMRERATAIGGAWHIESRPGAGTEVTIRLPRAAA